MREAWPQGMTNLLVCDPFPCHYQKEARYLPVCFVKRLQPQQPKRNNRATLSRTVILHPLVVVRCLLRLRLLACLCCVGALLLFDEADALFGKRSEIRDAHDRYANIEVGYLLQRIEAYDGLVILTTNLKGSLDSAFLRRFRFVVSFPFPDTEDRRRLWQIAFPDTAPVEEIDTHRLSRVVLSGGSIRNIALAAAFLAAEESGPINTDRVLRAASRELAKMERSSSELAEVMT